MAGEEEQVETTTRQREETTTASTPTYPEHTLNDNNSVNVEREEEKHQDKDDFYIPAGACEV